MLQILVEIIHIKNDLPPCDKEVEEDAGIIRDQSIRNRKQPVCLDICREFTYVPEAAAVKIVVPVVIVMQIDKQDLAVCQILIQIAEDRHHMFYELVVFHVLPESRSICVYLFAVWSKF